MKINRHFTKGFTFSLRLTPVQIPVYFTYITILPMTFYYISIDTVVCVFHDESHVIQTPSLLKITILDIRKSVGH